MDQKIQDKINTWLNGSYDEDTKNAIRELQKNNPNELVDAFYQNLEFGTGGLRGIMGVGTNRMNKYNVGMVTQGYANYLKMSFSGEVRVAIAHDSRNNSRFFAETTANVFAANGIKVFLFESLRPTPELSFAIRYLKCQGGVVCTASHNPKEYNGYKAYWDDGAHTSFHVFDDDREWLQIDKAGHMWTAYSAGRASTALWQWAGLSHNKAVWIGGLSGFLYQTGIEFMDAHSAKWGWSWGDIVANFAGSFLFMGQELLWKEQRIQYKFSFHRIKYNEPMLEARANDLFGESLPERMLKDYNAQTYWLSFNIRSFLKNSNWPAWLSVAAGYGADGMYGGFENKWDDNLGNEITRYDIPRKRQFYLAPDIDLTKIKTNSKFMRSALFVLNAFKFPAPALMIDSKGKFKANAIYF